MNNIIGYGSFGKVYLKEYNNTKSALKIIPKKFEHIFKNELKIVKIKHQNIIKILYVNISKINFYIYYEYASKGNLFNFILDYKKKNKSIDNNITKSVIESISNGLDFIHKLNIIHCDIKPSNILVCNYYIYKIADFGLSQYYSIKNNKNEIIKGTYFYMSPEYIKDSILHFSHDFWALGCILYEILTLERPFNDKKLYKLKENIVNVKYDINKISNVYKNLIRGLLKSDYIFRFNKIDIDNYYITKISKSRKNSLDKKFLPKNRKYYLPPIIKN
jgi:serine/threonine-protein kinase ULK4